MATDKKISELDLAISLTATDLVPITDSNGENKSIHGQQIKDFVGDEFSDDIQAVEDMISDSYDDLTFPVAAGKLCINDNKLYKANQDISTSETFDPLKWDQTTIEAAVANLAKVVTSNTLVADTVTYNKTGNVVQLSLVAYPVPANTGSYGSRHIIGYLPAGYRPIVNAYCPYVSSTINNLMVQYTDGEVSIRNSDANTQYAYISIIFITND